MNKREPKKCDSADEFNPDKTAAIPLNRTSRRISLVCPLTDTGPPPDHTMSFAGEYPCDDGGAPIEALRHSSNRQELAEGLWVDHYFSARPVVGTYEDYHHKMTHYAQVMVT